MDDRFNFDFDHDLPDMEGLHECIIKLRSGDEDFTFETESLDEAMEELHLYLDSPEFNALIEQHEADGEDMEKRLEELEQRLEEIEVE